MIGFETGGRRLTTRLIAGEYIKYMSRFPEEFGSRGDMPAVPLVEAVKRVALVAERGSSVRLSFGHGQVTIEAGTEGQARARETVTADFAGEETAIAFSPHYLMDGLGAALIAAVGTQDKAQGSGKAGQQTRAGRPARGRTRRRRRPSPMRRGSGCSSPARLSPRSSPAAPGTATSPRRTTATW